MARTSTFSMKSLVFAMMLFKKRIKTSLQKLLRLKFLLFDIAYLCKRKRYKSRGEKKKPIQQTEPSGIWEKQTPQGAQEQGPRGNRTQVKKACVTATAQLVP